MRLWFCYFREKKLLIFMTVLTAVLYVTVGSLYHIENLEKLLYAAVLSFVLWMTAGVRQGIKYVRKRKEIEMIFGQFEKSPGWMFRELGGKWLGAAQEGIDSAGTLEDALEMLLALICVKQSEREKLWEERNAESGDYYLMWTHQIKTPISAVKLLLERAGMQDRDSFLMKEELLKIEQYVEMVLTFQRMEGISADLVLEKRSLDALVRQTVKKYAVLFINRGLELELGELDMEIVTDGKWFGFCLEQLLSNSIKYTQKGKIHMGARTEAEGVVFWLEDTGIGIRSEDLPRIFDRGFTGDNGRLDKKSTGIGLYLCRRIFNHLGITVIVESEEGQGTKTTLKIPAENLTKA